MDSGRRRVTWTAEARGDLDAAVAFIAEGSISSALLVLDRILAATGSLDSSQNVVAWCRSGAIRAYVN